jgi:competence protein ComEA
MPAFSRAQLGILLLVAALLFSLYAWRGHTGWLSSAAQVIKPQPVVVEITGAVAHPGVYSFPAPPTLLAAWRQAGGPEPLPASDETLPSETRVEVSAGGAYCLGHMSGERLLTLGLALDVNTATARDLEALPGVGPVLAQRIIEYRQTRGPFQKMDDLLSVHGIGKKKLAHLAPLIRVSLAGTQSGP